MRLIDVDEVQKIIGYIRTKYVDTHNQFFWDTIRYIEKKVRSIPTIEAAPVVHGEWIDAEQYVDEDGLRYTQVRCSLCGRYEDEREPYCNCGADMRK